MPGTERYERLFEVRIRTPRTPEANKGFHH